MSYIFISYSRHDVQFARYLRALLEQDGLSVWMDEKRLQAGMDWLAEIEHAIDECAAFIESAIPAVITLSACRLWIGSSLIRA